MPAIDQIVESLDMRLVELRDEVLRLEAAHAALTNGHARVRRGRPRKNTNGASTVVQGTRREQVLAMLKVHDATASEIADTLGISRTQPFAVLRELLAAGEIEKDGRRYRAKV